MIAWKKYFDKLQEKKGGDTPATPLDTLRKLKKLLNFCTYDKDRSLHCSQDKGGKERGITEGKGIAGKENTMVPCLSENRDIEWGFKQIVCVGFML